MIPNIDRSPFSYIAAVIVVGLLSLLGCAMGGIWGAGIAAVIGICIAAGCIW